MNLFIQNSSVLKYLLAWCVTRNLDIAKSTTRVQIGDCCDGHNVSFEVSVVPLSCWCYNFSSHGSSLHQTKWQLREFFNTCFSLFASKVRALELRAQLKKELNPPPTSLHNATGNKTNDPMPPIYYGESPHCCQCHKSPVTYAAINSSVWWIRPSSLDAEDH